MKTQKILFKLNHAADLRRRKDATWSWCLLGETIESRCLTLRTVKIGRGELRWDPSKLIGETIRLSFHKTPIGNLMADLWRPSWAEEEDLAALFAHERRLYQVDQERLALNAAIRGHASESPVRVGSRRL